jgi:hypothetical protein
MTSDKEGFDVLRPRGDEQTTSQNDATFARAFELVDAKEFDQLVDHLRAHGTEAYVDDVHQRLIRRVAACGMPAIGAIDLLVEAGAPKVDVVRIAAVRGHVDLLQGAFERWDYHTMFGMGELLYYATGATGGFSEYYGGTETTETSVLKVLRWGLEVKNTYFCNLAIDELDLLEKDFQVALRNTLQKEYIDAAACLLDNHEDFGLLELTYAPLEPTVVDKREEIEGAANKGAVESLDFLSQRWGVEFVTNTVRKAALRDDNEDKIRRWLRKRTKSTVTVHLERAMSLIDEHKLTVPEGAYIDICAEIGKAYKKARYQ